MRYPVVIDRACGQDWSDILAKFFIDRDEVEVNKNAKTNKGNIRPS